MTLPESLTVCGTECRILRLLCRGKGGYSYLAKRDGQEYSHLQEWDFAHWGMQYWRKQ